MRPITDLIIRLQPYPQKLKEWCFLSPDFAKALKNSHPKRFISLGAVVVSRPRLTPEDEVIGFYVYDYGAKPNIFKQDFIVNIGARNKEFVIYTRFLGVSKSKYIKDITHFFEKYPSYSKTSHHTKFKDLPDEIKPRALEAIKLAKRIQKWGLREEISEKEWLMFDLELKKLGL